MSRVGLSHDVGTESYIEGVSYTPDKHEDQDKSLSQISDRQRGASYNDFERPEFKLDGLDMNPDLRISFEDELENGKKNINISYLSKNDNSASCISHTLEDTVSKFQEDLSTDALPSLDRNADTKSGKVIAKINHIEQEMKWMAEQMQALQQEDYQQKYSEEQSEIEIMSNNFAHKVRQFQNNGAFGQVDNDKSERDLFKSELNFLDKLGFGQSAKPSVIDDSDSQGSAAFNKEFIKEQNKNI